MPGAIITIPALYVTESCGSSHAGSSNIAMENSFTPPGAPPSTWSRMPVNPVRLRLLKFDSARVLFAPVAKDAMVTPAMALLSESCTQSAHVSPAPKSFQSATRLRAFVSTLATPHKRKDAAVIGAASGRLEVSQRKCKSAMLYNPPEKLDRVVSCVTPVAAVSHATLAYAASPVKSSVLPSLPPAVMLKVVVGSIV